MRRTPSEMSKKPGKFDADRALRELNAKIMRLPGSVPLRLERAQLLDRLGRTDEARKAYEDVLARDPQHFAAMTNLGLLLYRSGHGADALQRFREAVAHHPENAVAHANLGFMLLKGGDLPAARERYEQAVALDPKSDEAARGLATVLAQLGAAPAVAVNPGVAVPYRGTGTPLRVLVPVTVRAGNVRTDRLLDDRLFAVTKLVIEHCGDAVDVPVHDVIFNAIADADDAAGALARTSALLQSAAVPILNAPDRVALTGRAANAARLQKLDGVRAARIEPFAREALRPDALSDAGFTYPFLVRSAGYHSGEHFARIDRAGDVVSTVASLPGERLLAIEFIDTSANDGAFRKYRAMFVGGAIMPLHLAIAHDWKVHYFSSEMHDDAAFREEERAYLEDPRAAIGERAFAALESLERLLGLDYAGVDFALGRDGEAIVFEANATMVVPAPPAGDAWTYRRPAIDAIVSAFAQMVVQRASRTAV